jgi:hypothetical protein
MLKYIIIIIIVIVVVVVVSHGPYCFEQFEVDDKVFGPCSV